VLQVGVFFVFGALIVSVGWSHGIPALIAFIVFALVVARPLAVIAALAGTRLSTPVKVFIAWFGPKGVA
jgi:NhaP-type Na+/H+ and K+/H+ antiporter